MVSIRLSIYIRKKRRLSSFYVDNGLGDGKGLDVVLSLSALVGFKLVVAGTGKDRKASTGSRPWPGVGADYVGDVRGKAKAELLAAPRPSCFRQSLMKLWPRMVEALMSGTPVICSDRGACPEIISPEVGFVAVTKITWVTMPTCRGDK